jgi:hypothetical protein
MSFLAPLFLAGALAVAVPIVVHLTHRPQQRASPFPSLMFVRPAPVRLIRRQRLRHVGLLALRMAVVVLMALAFARPWLARGTPAAGAAGGARERVVVLDRSYSMGYGDRWERARAAAREALSDLGPGDRASLVLMDTRAIVVGPPGDAARALAALDTLQPGFGATRYTAGLQAARDLLARSPAARRECVLISDMQRTGLGTGEPVRLPAGVALRIVTLAELRAANVAITGLSETRAHRGSREEVTVTVEVANRGSVPARDVAVALDVGGRTLRAAAGAIEGGGTAVVRFRPFPIGSAPLRVAARIGPDPLVADNAYYAVVAPGEMIRVLVVTAEAAGEAEPGTFVARALALGDRPRFAVTLRPAGGVRPGDLENRALAILLAPPRAPGWPQRLLRFVEQGGGLLAVVGGAGTEGWRSEAWAPLLGGKPGAPTDPASGSAGGLAPTAYDHPVFNLFAAPHSGDVSAVQVYRYRRFDADTGTAVLAHYGDGGLALLEHALGRGRVLVWTTGMDNIWSDLPVQPIFLPLLYQMVRYMARYQEQPLGLALGSTLDIEAARSLVGERGDIVVTDPAGRRRVLGGAAPPLIVLDRPGFYTLQALAGERNAGTVAVNVDPAEGDLTPVEPQVLLARLVAPDTAAGAGGRVDRPATGADEERRQGMWWYLAMIAAVLALAETMVASRLPAAGPSGP